MNRIHCFAVMILAGCGRPDAAPLSAAPKQVETVTKVETAAIEHRKMPRYLTLTGSVLADKSTQMAANVGGHVIATYVERGQPVKRGQVIAVVDAKAAGYQQAAAVAQSKMAESQVELARQECARAETLFREGALSKSEYERHTMTCSAQLYSANAAQAQADLAGKLAGDTTIRAPMDGIIGERHLNVGEYVMPASPVASIYSIDPVRVSISVPEAAVALVKQGQTIDVEVAAYPDRTFPATVRFLSPTLRPGTRDMIIEAFAENKDKLLMPGMFATVRLTVGEEEQPAVPKEAIRVEGTVRRLFLAKEGTAYEMVVRTGVEKDGYIAVLEPLAEGDRVIVKPPPGLRDRSAIQ